MRENTANKPNATPTFPTPLHGLINLGITTAIKSGPGEMGAPEGMEPPGGVQAPNDGQLPSQGKGNREENPVKQTMSGPCPTHYLFNCSGFHGKLIPA